MSEVEITRDQRCAIYTRKSTDDRVDRDFNSIESQLDICSAYITCQRHKGWAKARGSSSLLDRTKQSLSPSFSRIFKTPPG